MQRLMRQMRFKHGISVLELAGYSDVSSQRLSQIELGEGNHTEHMNQLVQTAFIRLIAARRDQLAALEADFNKCRQHLLEYTKEDTP